MPVYHENWLEIRPIPDTPPGISRREAEGMAWRAIVRERLGENIRISYNENGAPVLSNIAELAENPAVEPAEPNNPAKHPGYIGVSHTKGWVAVIWSPEPCAIDIELKTRKISPESAARVGITPDIATSPDADPLPPIAAWCAYEALYKYKSVAEVTLADTPKVHFLPHPDLIVAVIQ